MALSKILENSITDGVVSAAKLKDFAAAVDLNGVELILDADQDTSITADTDDQIDIRIAGADHLKVLSSSGDTVLKPMVDAKDIVFQQFDGNKLFCIDDGNFVSVGGNAAAPGEIRIYEDTDNGTHYTGFKAGNNTASVAYVLPTADGTSGHQLTTDGSGTLSWSSAGTTLANDANNRVVTGTGSGLNGEANLTFDGSTLAVTGAITGSSDLTLQDDLILDSDAAVLSFGEDNEITLTHVADTGLLLNGASVIQFRDSAINIGSPADGDLDINADDEVEINSTLIDVNGNLDVSGTIVGASTLSATTITASTAFVPDASDGAALGTTALEFSDLFLADAAVIALGADQDVTLTHVADTGILLNSTNVIQFNDASQNIGAPSATVLDINATDEIELNATLVDINANVEISGTATTTGVHTFTATPVFSSDITVTDDINLISDSAEMTFGANSEIKIIHQHDSGLAIKHTATADDKPINLILQTGETDIAANDVIGTISFQAPDEGTGTDAILVAAGISAVSEGDFSASNNATKLSFKTGASEAASEKMSLSSDGTLTVAHDVILANDSFIQFGGASETISGDGTDMTIATNNITIDAAGDINLDAGGTDVRFKTGGTTFFDIYNSSNNVVMEADISDADITFRGNDGGSATNFLTLDSSEAGRATFNDDIIMGTSGKGIYLGVTSATAANHLDDYEEGTWTPTITDLGGNAATLSSALGTYTKIGRQVILNYKVVLSSKASMTGNYVHISGLPFNHATATNGTGTIDFFKNMANSFSSLAWDTTSTVTVAWLTGVDGTGVQGSDFSSGNAYNNLHIAGCYSTA